MKKITRANQVMTSVAPVVASRQNFHTAVTFMAGLSGILTRAVLTNPNSFTDNERRLLDKLVDMLEYMSTTVWFTDYEPAYRDETIAKINTTFSSIVIGTPVSDVMALLVKCYEIVNSAARVHVEVSTSMPTVLVDLVMLYTSIQQNLPVKEFIDILRSLWEYVIGLDPGVTETNVNLPSKPNLGSNSHPISDISWIPNSAYGIMVALMLKKYYNFDGRFTKNNKYYNVDRVKLVDLFEKSGTVSDREREGLTSIIYTFKRPDWNPSDYEHESMIQAVKGNTDIITELRYGNGATQHTLSIQNARIYNYMPFREWFDLCNMNGDSVWQFREGDNTTGISDLIYTLSIGGTHFTPTDSISLGPNDSAKITNINTITLTGIVKDGQHYPDINFTKDPIY